MSSSNSDVMKHLLALDKQLSEIAGQVVQWSQVKDQALRRVPPGLGWVEHGGGFLHVVVQVWG